MQDASPDLLVGASRLAQALGQQHVVIIGGLAAFLFGVERYTADLDLATNLSPEDTARRLAAAGFRAEIRRASEGNPIPWVVRQNLMIFLYKYCPCTPLGLIKACRQCLRNTVCSS